ncbi:hypothetical protein M0Q50_09830 [bacterium]|jgi:hypothetical protein|nr:hypothetical protein [bacterium]
MPTGYTCGILDGSIKDFKEFATVCMRAFGATIHMRDDDLTKSYEPRIPSDYYKRSLDDSIKKLKNINKLTDDEIVEEEKKSLEKYIIDYNKYIIEKKNNKKLLSNFLKEAYEFEPPTEEHVEFRNFMIDQIQKTIVGDCNYKYYEKEIAIITERLNNIDPIELRNKKIEFLNEDIIRAKQSYQEEIDRCNLSNNWVTDLTRTLDNIKRKKKLKTLE